MEMKEGMVAIKLSGSSHRTYIMKITGRPLPKVFYIFETPSCLLQGLFQDGLHPVQEIFQSHLNVDWDG